MTASKLARILTISVVLSALGLGGTAHAQDGDTLSQPAGITQSDPSQPQPDEPTPQPPGTPQDPASPEDLAAPENPGTIPGSTTTTRPPVVRPKSLPVTVSPRAGRPGTTVTLHDPARVLALSDGVFAIIITLLVLVAIALMRVVIWLYATNHPHLLWQRLDDRQRRAGLALNLYPGLVYLLAFLVAKAAPGVSLLIYAAMPVLYFLSITVLRSSRKRNQEYADFT
jgi:hypothetical protein